MMDYCFIEKWHPGWSLPANSQAMALTPNAYYQLTKAGIDSQSFADYFSSGQIRGETDDYLSAQLVWLAEFDEFVKEIFPEAKMLNLNLPSLYFYNVKYHIDCIILTARIINSFIQETNPAKIWFLPEIYGEDKLGRWLLYSLGESSFLRVMRCICKEKGIEFVELKTADVKGKENVGNNQRQSKTFANIASEWKSKLVMFSKIKLIKIYQFLKAYYNGFRLYSYKKISDGPNLFIIKESKYVLNFCEEAKKIGFNLFLSSKKLINFQASDIKIYDVDSEKKIMDRLISSNIMHWINQECGVDVSDILYSRLQYFIFQVFTETLDKVNKYIKFFKEYSIDFVVNYSLSTEDDFAAVAAANLCDSVKTVCFYHGVDALECKSRFFTEFNLYDFYFASTKEEVEHIKKLAKIFKREDQYIGEYPYFRNMIKERFVKRKVYKWDKPLVVFVPIMRVERMNMPIEKAQSLQWDYFSWHEKLVDYFASQSDFCFVWKSLLQYYDRGDTVVDMIRDKKSTNLIFKTDQLSKYLQCADRVLFDMPSTAFYEAIFAGLPVLSLYRPNDQKLYDKAYYIYGESLQPYYTIAEGLGKIEKFLNSDRNKYIVRQEHTDLVIPSILYDKWKNKEGYGGKDV